VREALAIYQEICGDTLTAVYVEGSVHRGEAVLGISDLDMSGYISAPLPPAAREHFYLLTDTRLARWPPLPRGVGVPRMPDWLKGAWLERPSAERADAVRRWLRAVDTGVRPDPEALERVRYLALAFLHRYDTTLVYGDDVLAGYPVPAPAASLARVLVRGPVRIVRLASQGRDDPESPLPTEPVDRLRRLARLTVRIGASVLMAHGGFRSFRGVDVLPALEHHAPRWANFLQDTGRCYVRVQPHAPAGQAYLCTLADFAEWSQQEVEAAWAAAGD
jgi:hypothetical protein